MNDDQLLRFSRQILLPQIDIDGQERILASRVLVVGAGGLGSPVILYLAAAGVGHLTVIDPDAVDDSNLQRQILHDSSAVGQPKVDSVRPAISRLGSDTMAMVHPVAFTEANGAALVAGVDVIVDCSDNFATRFLLNRLSVEHRIPLVSGAAIRMEGHLVVFDPRRDDSPCYRCLYDESGQEDMRCSQNGILAPVVGVIGAMQAVEVLKLVSGLSVVNVGRLFVWDALTLETRHLRIRRDPACPVCGEH